MRATFSPLLALSLSLVSATVLVACGGAAKGPPVCAPSMNRGAVVWQGDALGADMQGTRQKAFANALSEGLSPLGVKVKGDVKIQQRQQTKIGPGGKAVTTGVDSVESNQTIKLDEVEVRSFKVTYCRPANKGQTIRAVVTLPGSEFNRIKRMKTGRTLVVLDCKSEPDGACSNDLAAGLRKAADQAHLSVSDVIKPPKDISGRNGQDLLRLGASKGAAYVLWVELSGRFKVKEDDVLYAFADGWAGMTETSDGKSLRSVSLDPAVKGAVYEQVGAQKNAPVDATRESLRGAVRELSDQIRWWKKPTP